VVFELSGRRTENVHSSILNSVRQSRVSAQLIVCFFVYFLLKSTQINHKTIMVDI